MFMAGKLLNPKLQQHTESRAEGKVQCDIRKRSAGLDYECPEPFTSLHDAEGCLLFKMQIWTRDLQMKQLWFQEQD